MQNSDDNKFDLEFRSVFENAREDVPDRVWESLEPRLEVIAENARRRLWLRRLRYVTAVSAAAAVVAIGLLFPWNAVNDVAGDVTVSDGIAAAVEEKIEVVTPETDIRPEDRYIALAAEPVEKDRTSERTVPSEVSSPEQLTILSVYESATVESGSWPESADYESSETETDEQAVTETGYVAVQENTSEEKLQKSIETERFDGDDAVEIDGDGEGSGIVTSIVVSGNAVSNSRSGGRYDSAPMKVQAAQRPNSVVETSSSSYSIPLSFGIGTKIAFTPRWSLGVGVSYSVLSRSFKGYYYEIPEEGSAGNVPYVSTSIVNTLSYIGIPLNVYFNIVSADFLDFYVYAGGAMEKCIGNVFRMKELSPSQGNRYKEKVAGLQWSVDVGLGAEFILTDWLGLYLDPSLRYYFPGSQPKSIRTEQPLTFGCELGLRIRL